MAEAGGSEPLPMQATSQPRRRTTAGRPEETETAEDESKHHSEELGARPEFARIQTAPTGGSDSANKRSSLRPRNLNRELTFDFDDYGSTSESSADEQSDHRFKRKRDDSDPYSKFSVGNDEFRTRGRVSKRDGRLKLSINEHHSNGYLAKALSGGLRHHLFPDDDRDGEDTESETSSIAEDRKAARAAQESIDDIFENPSKRPRLNIVIIVIGSRGDIQPFLRIGKVLQNDYGHRVRIATHPAFKDFIEKDAGLEFYSVGGNPSELMAFMVKNPGLIPNYDTIKKGEIGRRRSEMYEMFQGMFRACVDQKISDDPHSIPFVADAIIANPPSFAHIHIAERLGIPLHMMFTFPFSPTAQFPHPLANIKNSNVNRAYANFMSYPLVELLQWSGLGDILNNFREKSLGIEPVSTLWAPGQLYRLEVPYTYMWSPSLVPKPKDWGPNIDISGFVFLELASSFHPPKDLADFLDAGEPPIYIGFGSIVVDNPDKFTQMIFAAVKEAGVRALVSKGWGGIGGDGLELPENILLLENTPHDWLFPRCKAVVHHGGAGTTAIGLKCAKPTMIVPFFGDQPFWGSMVAKARAGAFECTPYKKLTIEKLVQGIRECLTEEAQTNVQKIADSIAKEGDGAVNAVRSFHRSLPWRGIRSMRCSILEERAAVWRIKGTSVRLSALAAELLVKKKRITYSDLTLLRHMEWNDFEGPGEPITGAGIATMRSVRDMSFGVGGIPYNVAKETRRRMSHGQKKKRHESKIAESQARKAEREANGTEGDMTRQTTKMSVLSADPDGNIATAYAHEATHGVSKSTKALVKLPMDLSIAVAQGFHNAPRLYGDETVRRPHRITGLKSGLIAGRNEFAHGMVDAVTGLYRLPARGMKQHGFMGLAEGVALSLGGLVLKPIAGLISPIPFAAKGVEKEYHARRGDAGTNRYIRKVRIAQGERELQEMEDAAGRIQGKPGSSESCETDNNRGSRHTPNHHHSHSARSGDDAVNDRGLISIPTKDREGLARDDLENTLARLKHGWAVITEVLQTQQKIADRGFVARMKLNREKKRWRETGALESVESAEQALRARRKGIPVEESMAQNALELQEAQKPRLPGMQTTESSADADPPASTEVPVVDEDSEGSEKGNGEPGSMPSAADVNGYHSPLQAVHVNHVDAVLGDMKRSTIGGARTEDA